MGQHWSDLEASYCTSHAVSVTICMFREIFRLSGTKSLEKKNANLQAQIDTQSDTIHRLGKDTISPVHIQLIFGSYYKRDNKII